MAYKRQSPMPVIEGGTGVITMTTAYAPVVAGTTATGALQVASTGLSTSGFVLTSTGASSVPTFQTPAASSISITGDTGGALTGAAFTFAGGTTGLAFGGAGTTETLSGTLSTANGGTGASNLTGILIGNGGTGPVTGQAVTQYDVLVGGASNTITSISPSTATFVLTSNGVSADPTFQAITGGGLGWSVITASQTAVVNNGYIANDAGTLALLLPATAAIGDIIRVTGINNATGWQITQNANQQIFFGTAATTIGVGGSITSTSTQDSIEIVCVVAGASTNWNVLSSVGNLTVA